MDSSTDTYACIHACTGIHAWMNGHGHNDNIHTHLSVHVGIFARRTWISAWILQRCGGWGGGSLKCTSNHTYYLFGSIKQRRSILCSLLLRRMARWPYVLYTRKVPSQKSTFPIGKGSSINHVDAIKATFSPPSPLVTVRSMSHDPPFPRQRHVADSKQNCAYKPKKGM